MHRPALANPLYQQIFGDKEVYWIACVLGGSVAVLSKYSYASAGQLIACGKCEGINECVQPYAFVLAQYHDVDPHEGGPELSHLNGEGVLLAMALGNKFAAEKFAHISPPTLYGDSSQRGTCQPVGGQPRSLSKHQLKVIQNYHDYWRWSFSALPEVGGEVAAVERAKRKLVHMDQQFAQRARVLS